MDHAQEIAQLIQSSPKPRKPLGEYILTQSALSALDIPPREFLIGEWMPKDSVGMVFAPRGVGKSWFCMALAVSITEGRKRFLGWEINSHERVLYVDGEMATVEIKERFSGLCASPNDYLHILPSERLYREGRPLSIDALEEQHAVDEALDVLKEAGTPIQVIVFENLSTLRRGINENDNDAAKPMMDWFQDLRHRGYTVIIVHHSGKSGQQRGASILEVTLDYIIRLDRPDLPSTGSFQGACFNLSFDKIRGKRPANDEPSVSLKEDQSGVLQLTCNMASRGIEPEHRLLRYLHVNGRNSHREMAKEIGVAYGRIGRLLRELELDGLVAGHGGDPKVTPYGLQMLFELWPEEFPRPEGSNLVQQYDCPF